MQRRRADASEPESEGEEEKTGLGDKIRSFVAALAWPCMVQLIPQLTRCSCHRGEVYNLKHHELMCGNLGIRDEPGITKHAQEGTTSADHSYLVHSGTGPYCNPYARQVCT